MSAGLLTRTRGRPASGWGRGLASPRPDGGPGSAGGGTTELSSGGGWAVSMNPGSRAGRTDTRPGQPCGQGHHNGMHCPPPDEAALTRRTSATCWRQRGTAPSHMGFRVRAEQASTVSRTKTPTRGRPGKVRAAASFSPMPSGPQASAGASRLPGDGPHRTEPSVAVPGGGRTHPGGGRTLNPACSRRSSPEPGRSRRKLARRSARATVGQADRAAAAAPRGPRTSPPGSDGLMSASRTPSVHPRRHQAGHEDQAAQRWTSSPVQAHHPACA